MTDEYSTSGYAEFSADRRYRYILRRRIAESPRRLLFVMLNPSKADEERNDPTIRRCIGFAREWGFGNLEVVNLFAFMSTNPKALLETEDPVGSGNDGVIRTAMQRADLVVLAWGNNGLLHEKRVTAVTAMAREAVQPYCLGLTMKGAPKHPLRLPKTTTLVPF